MHPDGALWRGVFFNPQGWQKGWQRELGCAKVSTSTAWRKISCSVRATKKTIVEGRWKDLKAIQPRRAITNDIKIWHDSIWKHNCEMGISTNTIGNNEFVGALCAVELFCCYIFNVHLWINCDHCGSSNVSLNCLPEKMHSHTGCICSPFLRYVF